MAWRIHDHVLRGEIDNRVRGRVTGTIWLEGLESPMVLDLKGDCHPDLAGCLLKFKNPAPALLKTAPPSLKQNGEAGDITAARKVRVFDIPFEEAYALLKAGGKPPEHTANCLYLEWYSRRNGRVVVESTDYRLEVSEPTWRYSREELAERQRRASEGGEFVTRIELPEDEEPWDEFRSEQSLRNSDMVGEKYRALLKKYMDHPDRDRIIAHEMGWTWLEEALDAQARGATQDDLDEEEDELLEMEAYDETPPDPEREGIDWVHDEEEGYIHPVAKRARDLLDPLLDEMKTAGEENAPDDEPFYGFVSELMNCSVKLSAHLSFLADPDRGGDAGLLIAWLKRDLDILNKTLAALDALLGHQRFPEERCAFFRAELFSVREGVLEIVKELRRTLE